MAITSARADERYMRIVDFFVDNGLIEPAQRQSALEVVANGGSLRNFLKECNRYIADATYVSVAGMEFHIASFDLSKKETIPQAVIGLVPAELAHNYRVLPLEIRYGDTLALAVHDPLTRSAFDAVSAATGKNLRVYISAEPLEGLIGEYYPLQR